MYKQRILWEEYIRKAKKSEKMLYAQYLFREKSDDLFIVSNPGPHRFYLVKY